MEKNEVWESFKKKYLFNLENCSEEIENFLMDEDIKNYIIDNDKWYPFGSSRFDALGRIANSSSEKLREYYFSEENINILLEKKKFGENVWNNYKFFPNKVKLLDKEYILMALAKLNKFFLGNMINDLVKEIDRDESIKDMEVKSKYNCIIKLFDYYMKDIDNNIDILPNMFNNLPFELHKYIIITYADVLKKYENIAPINFSYDCFFLKYSSKAETFHDHEITFLDELFQMTELFKEHPKIFSCFEFISGMLYKMPSELDYDWDKKKLEQISTYKRKVQEYFKNKEVKLEFLNNIDKFGKNFNRIFIVCGIDLINFYLDQEGLEILERNNTLSSLFSSDIDLGNFLKKEEFAKLLSSQEYSHEDFNRYLSKIIKTTSLENVKLLLNHYLNLRDYQRFYNVFLWLESREQLIWISNNKNLFLEHLIHSELLFKGMKKDCYILFKKYINYKDYDFSEYELKTIILKKSFEYSREQLIKIYIDSINMEKILNMDCFSRLFVEILNLNIEEITEVYLGDEFQTKLREDGKLTKIYASLKDLKINHSKVLFIPENLKKIGEDVNLADEWLNLFNYKSSSDYPYFYFFYNLNNTQDKELIFKVLDYYLINYQYLTCFELLKEKMEREMLEEYYETRKKLITKIINESNSRELYRLFTDLDKEQLKKEITKDREKLIYGLNFDSLSSIFYYDLEGAYKLDEKILDIDRFTSVFSDGYLFIIDDYLDSILESKETKENLKNNIIKFLNMKENILKSLNDNKTDFKIYLRIVYGSSFFEYLDDSSLEFLNDMKELVVGNDYKRTINLFYKYQNIDLEKIKLKILEDIENKSKASILSSLTDISDFEIVNEDYFIENKKYNIPVIYFDGQPYNFLVRRMCRGEHLFDGKYVEKIECYSTIFEGNRSVFYGDSGIKFGYSDIPFNDITYMYPFDAITKRNYECKYIPKGLKIPMWLSANDMNERTKNNNCYNELRIKGKHIPNFVIAYDEPNDVTVEYASKHNVPMVKILRKKYPKSIERCDDPYSNWQ